MVLAMRGAELTTCAARSLRACGDCVRCYGGLGGWHYGVWDGSVATHGRSLVRATELLFEGIELDESTRVLDVGCGVGDLASWVSTRHGCQVLGLTIVPEHIELARERCSELDGRVRFALGDMNDLDLEPESFDVIVNQETLCYAIDPCDYLTTRRQGSAALKVQVAGHRILSMRDPAGPG